MLASSPALAEGAVKRMTYEVYAGGINAVTANLDVDISSKKDRYSLMLSAFTKGFLGSLVPWSGTFETRGWTLKDNAGQPEVHRSVANWRDEEEVKEYSYDRQGRFVGYSIADPENDGTPRVPDDELVQGTIDILTATMRVMNTVGDGGSCAGTADIFDGERRFKMDFRFEDHEELQASRYNVYQGPSQRCVVEITPVAGRWHEKPRGWLSIQEQGRQKGSLPTIWFAKIDPNGPAVPVKIRIKTEYGGMFMHLVNYSDGQSIVTADIIE